MSKFKKILLINFGGIGDEILFLPTIISLKKEFLKSDITLVLEPRSLGIKTLTNKIDKFLPLNVKGKNKYFELLKLVLHTWIERYDIVVSSGTNKFIPILLFLTCIKTRIGYNSGKLSEKLLTHSIPLNKNQYAALMYHDLISPLTSNRTELPELDVETLPKITNTILIHPGVSKMSAEKGITKTISPELWAEVIKKLVQSGKRVQLAGGPDDKECIEKITAACSGLDFENFYGKTHSLKGLARLISSAEKFVCSDSAPLHIAAALGVKTYAIFGPTDDKKLTPPTVVALKTEDNCPLKPCLWEKRKTTCKNPVCLNFNADDIVKLVK